MKKICIFCETWASGGIESFLTKLITQMDLSDLQIDLVAAQVKDSVFTEPLTAAGVRIIPLSGSKTNWLANTRQFSRILAQNHYDVVHVNAFQGLQLYYLHLAKRAGVPMRIAHSHGSDLRKSPLRPVKLLLHTIGKKLFAKSATHHWACSRLAAEFMYPPNADWKFIPNGIDTQRFRFRAEERVRIRAELGLEEKIVVGCVGRLQYDKNQAFLLEVLSQLLPNRPETMLLLIGDGPARKDLEEKAISLGVSDHVLFYGLSDHVEELLWAMDAFVFPSLSEGLGLVAIEAQAAGLPTLCAPSIPEEACLTTLFKRLPLEPGLWADALNSVPNVDRKDFSAAVARAGFESKTVAARVRVAYLNETEKEM